MKLYIDLNTFPQEHLSDVIKQYYTSDLIFKYKDSTSLLSVLDIYNTLKKSSIINLICEDSSINVFIYDNPQLACNHTINIFPKDFNVYKNIFKALKDTSSKWLIVNNIFNLSRDYEHLIEYLQSTEKPLYYVHGLDELAIYNYKKLIEYTRVNKKPLAKPTNLYGYHDTYEVIFDDRLYFKNINTSKLEYIPIQSYPLTNDKYIMTQINNPNYNDFINNKETYMSIYQQLYKYYLNARCMN